MDRSKEKGLYGQEEELLAHSDAFFEFLTKWGIPPDPQNAGKKKSSKKKKQTGRYHNTLMLLQQYRTIVWMMECFPETVADELERPFKGGDTLLEQMDIELAMENRKLKTRMEGIRRSRLLLDQVNEALTMLKKKPVDGERLYQLIYLTYIAPETLSHAELLSRLDMSSRNYYRLRQQAVTVLSIRLWAAPTREVDIWLELLALLESTE